MEAVSVVRGCQDDDPTRVYGIGVDEPLGTSAWGTVGPTALNSCCGVYCGIGNTRWGCDDSLGRERLNSVGVNGERTARACCP